MRAIIWCAVSTKGQANEEKDSLESQEREAIEICQTNGWIVLDILRVPGFSRNFDDIYECAAAMRAEGIDAFDKFLEYTEGGSNQFDVLIVRDSDRFARTQPLHTRVVSNVINKAHAKIFSRNDGWVDEQNAQMFMAMGGYKTAQELKRIRDYNAMGMKNRISKGLHANTPPLSHVIERTASGKPIRMIINDKNRRLIDDMVTVVLQGVGWNRVEVVLNEEYGHPKLFQGATFRTFHNPYFWGHSARNYRYKSKLRGYTGEWQFDASVPPPDGITMYYNTHEPAVTGDQAEQLKAELRRRHALAGRAPRTAHLFTGLLICDECGSVMIYREGGHHTYYGCLSHLRAHYRTNCQNTKFIRETAIHEYLTLYLKRKLAEAEQVQSKAGPSPQERIIQLKKELETLEKRIATMVRKQSEAPESVGDIYKEQIDQADKQRMALKKHIQAAASKMVTPSMERSRKLAYQELLAVGLEKIWDLPSARINSVLRKIMGREKLVVRDGQIIKVRMT